MRSVSRRKTAGLLAAALWLPAAIGALPAGFVKTLIADKLDAVFIASAPDGRIFFTEKKGMIRIIKNDKLLPAPFADISSITNNANERGMIGIAIDKNFATNGYVYSSYSDKADQHDYVIRFKANGDVAEGAPTKIFDLLKHPGTFHHGMDVVWGFDDKLYLTRGNGDGAVGDKMALSKGHDEIWGSLLRINPDGTMPSDNPFYAENQGDARAVWTYGDRNAFSPRFNKDGVCLFDDVMDSPGDDEINECKSGQGYGYGGGGATAPLLKAGGGKAQVGSMWYEGTQFPAQYRGLFFFGNSGNGRIRMFNYASKTATDFDDLGGPGGAGTGDCPIGFTMGKDGSVFVSTRCGTGAQSSITYARIYKYTYGSTPVIPVQYGLQPDQVMRWSVLSGAVSVELLGGGSQTLELLDLSGKRVAQASADSRGQIRLDAQGAKGTHLLVWKDGADAKRRTVAKVVLD
jgi:glucose/arabinose dehydrogenase